MLYLVSFSRAKSLNISAVSFIQRLVIRALAILSLSVASLSAQAAAPKDAALFFNQSLGDFSEELDIAKEDGKVGVLLMFEMDECPFCYRMKQTVLNQPDVQEYFRKHFLIFPVDVEGDVQITDFRGDELAMKDFALKKHRVRATPVFAFFDLKGQRIARFTGATRGKDEFLQLGEYVVSGAYKKQSFASYKRAQKAK